jgi:peptidoglycan/LPS O-acetylase OafA/YrhL
VEHYQRRLDYLDALRGIAAVSVMYSHYIAEMHDEGLLSGFEVNFFTFTETLNFGKFGVVLFFLISGYIIPNSLGKGSDRIGRFCISRFFRLYPLYWALLVVVLILIGGEQLSSVVANITMVQGYLGKPDLIGPAWTLQIELTFYATCVMMAAVHRLSSPRACFIASLGFLFVAVVLGIARGVLVKKLPVALPLSLSLMYFGTLWRQATFDLNPDAARPAKYMLAVLCGTIIPLSVIAYNHDFGFHESWLQYSVSYLAAIACFVLCTTKLLISGRFIVWLGVISYSMYLLHALFTSSYLPRGWSATDLNMDPLLYVVLRSAVVIGVAYITYTVIEKPFQRIGRSVISYRSGIHKNDLARSRSHTNA